MVCYVPPHQRGYQNNNQNTQSQQHGNQGPRENFHQGQGSSSNHPSGMNASHPNSKLPRQIEDVEGDSLNSQQHIQGNMQANNDLVHKIQDAQQEQKAVMDMLTKQLSQMATTLNEIRGYDGKIPATIKMLDKANISKFTQRSGKDYDEPLGRTEEEDGEENNEDTPLKEAREPFPQFAEPQPLDLEPHELIKEVKEHERDDPGEGTRNAVKQTLPIQGRDQKAEGGSD